MSILSKLKGMICKPENIANSPHLATHAQLRAIEFIGPSAIGKSTFCAAYEQISGVSWNHVRQLTELQLVGGETELNGGIHWKLLKRKLASIDLRPLNGYRKAKLMNYFSQIIFQDLMLFYSQGNSSYLLDEGICHNYAEQINELNDEDFLAIMSGRRLVYVRTDNPELVANRIRKRANETGFMVTHHIGLDNKSLAKIAETSIIKFDRMVKRLSVLGIPYCTLFAEYTIQEAQQACIEFERQLFKHAG